MRRSFYSLLILLPFFALEGTAAQLPAVGIDGGPTRNLNEQEVTNWLAGREIFEREWTAEEGLGSPSFNGSSCASCHKDPVTGGSGSNEFNVPQDLSAYSGRRPRPRGNTRTLSTEPIDQLAAHRKRRKERADEGASASQLLKTFPGTQTPSLLGLGRIDTISDEEILRREDPEDRDGDGIRGFARRITVQGREEIGRFGWKSRTPRLSDFVCMALQGEVGLTVPDQGRGFGAHADSDAIADPELEATDFDRLNFFISQLAPPLPSSEWLDYQAQVGEGLFTTLGCAKCHVPELQGSEGPVPLYSDLLLHDLTPESRGKEKLEERIARLAERNGKDTVEPLEIRTPPLWGISKTAPYWHDGTAADLHAAILAHHGEAEAASQGYSQLEEIDQQALVRFLGFL